MEWWVVIVLVIAILVILFPAAYVWNLNASATYAAIKRAWEKRAVRTKVAADTKTKQGNYQGAEMPRMRRAAFGALFFVVAILFPVLIWVAFIAAIRELSLRWRESRLPSALVCRLDSDCPPGYVCLDGRCVPQY